MNPQSREQANHLLEVHGADPARWPVPSRALLEQADPGLRTQQQSLDAWLATSVPPPAPARLRAAILLAAHEAAASRRSGVLEALLALWQDLGGARLAVPAFALALALGVGLGAGMLPALSAPSDAANDDLLSLAMIDDGYAVLFTEEVSP
ncbi:MAG TPA: hypothetical protein PLK29_01185 [Chiayiivirga sp.]|nr:hypothetical protein [Chiayiivirga sp.]